MIHHVLLKDLNHEGSKKIIWSTDLHLDAANKKANLRFLESILSQEPDVVLIGGDICNGIKSLRLLRNFAKLLKGKCYFVLGNHDYYYNSIQNIRLQAEEIFKDWKNIKYLTEGGIVELTPSIGLLGHDGWGDGRAGNFLQSTVMLNDYFLIKELKNLSPENLLIKLNQLGNEAAEYVKTTLQEAFQKYDEMIFLTHTPPFVEVCYYKDKMTDDNWSPHFVCKAMGEVLIEILKENPSKRLLVLCGHSHSSVDKYILPNLHILSGHCELGSPAIQGIIKIN